jgi:hypothetical protein
MIHLTVSPTARSRNVTRSYTADGVALPGARLPSISGWRQSAAQAGRMRIIRIWAHGDRT